MKGIGGSGDKRVYPTREPADGLVIEDFEDGDISEYVGDTTEPTVNQTRPFHRDFALEWVSAGQNDGTIDTQEKTIDRPAKWRWNLYKEGPKDGAMVFAVQSSPSGYKAGNKYVVDNRSKTNNAVRIRKILNGNKITVASTDDIPPNQEWLDNEVHWEADGTITFSIFDRHGNHFVTISGVDTQFSSGGIGWRSDDPQSKGYYDYARHV